MRGKAMSQVVMFLQRSMRKSKFMNALISGLLIMLGIEQLIPISGARESSGTPVSRSIFNSSIPTSCLAPTLHFSAR